MEDVEKVIAWWTFADRILVREERHELRILGHEWVHLLHRQLLVVRNLDELDFRLLEQLLLSDQDLL